MQSTGQTSTQAASLVPMQGSVMTKGIRRAYTKSASPRHSSDEIQGGLTEADKRGNVIRLVFGGSQERFDDFVRVIREEIPEGTGAVLRGSAVTGIRWR